MLILIFQDRSMLNRTVQYGRATTCRYSCMMLMEDHARTQLATAAARALALLHAWVALGYWLHAMPMAGLS